MKAHAKLQYILDAWLHRDQFNVFEEGISALKQTA